MKNIPICAYALYIVALISTCACSSPLLPFATYTGYTPGNVYVLGNLKATDTFKITLTYGGTAATLAMKTKNSAGTIAALAAVTGQSTSIPNGVIISRSAVSTDQILAVVQSTGFATYDIEIAVNNVVIQRDSGITLNALRIPVKKIVTGSACTGKLTFSGPSSIFGVYDSLSLTANLLSYTLQKELIVNFPRAGTYYLVVLPSTTTFPIRTTALTIATPLVPFTVNLFTYCDRYCTNPAFPTYQPECKTCGNGVLEDGEECDNGNNPGCRGCYVEPNYSCSGNPGSSSLCIKYAVCGDGIVDKGEDCDTGSQPGCTSLCKVDAGYKCTSVVGAGSACGFCGNGIIQGAEECDNKNSPGCSADCKVNPGFQCRKPNSICVRKNPVCGNGIIEIGESCDDGNTVDGDGCSKTCLVEQDYACSGQFGQKSECQKQNSSPEPVCGNSVVEAGEQCDNGNNDGCHDCTIEFGYSCINRVSAPSICILPSVPHCGNGVFQPQAGQICDDNNVNNGDGCNSFCFIESGWICPDRAHCINLQDPGSNRNCGNGIFEAGNGEGCDDGNTVSGDGCSQCRVDNGWVCTTIANKSRCTRRADTPFCGNGVVEGNETCDDGFPLKDNDGCSRDCQLEQGWYCIGIKCYKK